MPRAQYQPNRAWVIVTLLAACASPRPSAPVGEHVAIAHETCTARGEEDYRAAVIDARTVKRSKIVELIAIAPRRRDLRWRADGMLAESRLLVVTWTRWDGYRTHPGQQLVLTREAWVTIPEEMTHFCSRVPPACLRDRITEYLGMPHRPIDETWYFALIWVRPADMFRACPDPEVSEPRCDVEFPTKVDAAHRAWFDAQRAEQAKDTGYPWTQLGYTYDWGASTPHVGASEFVVRRGATVIVEAANSADEFCRGSEED